MVRVGRRLLNKLVTGRLAAPLVGGVIEKEGSVRLSGSCRSFAGYGRQFMAETRRFAAVHKFAMLDGKSNGETC